MLRAAKVTEKLAFRLVICSYEVSGPKLKFSSGVSGISGVGVFELQFKTLVGFTFFNGTAGPCARYVCEGKPPCLRL